MPYEDSELYDYGGTLVSRLVEHYIELVEVLLLVIAALVQTQSFAFHQVLAVLYFADFCLEVTYLKRVSSPGIGAEKRDKELVRSWIWMDLTGATLIFMTVVHEYWRNSEIVSLYSSIVIGSVVIGIAHWDYSKNRDVYFGLPKKTVKKANRKRKRYL